MQGKDAREVQPLGSTLASALRTTTKPYPLTESRQNRVWWPSGGIAEYLGGCMRSAEIIQSFEDGYFTVCCFTGTEFIGCRRVLLWGEADAVRRDFIESGFIS